ncbi:Rieske (2Fe-2S) protein [Cohnella pontilimi]|uniref:Rieske (2Fe-2S) protein n=1 Tax=Cohnella pontilimi TaxID=2564100 RepID=A0A4V5LSD3_9BACL|nr:Rieske (2Fe-2S) protein [Cohnella pontilimi]TJY42619.1 Rieske (2Fe-2S) protein [Cohnella pontilimi]
MSSKIKHRLVVSPSSDLQEGQRLLIEVNGSEIGIIRAEGKCYAFRNACPHQGVQMIYGSVTGTMLPSDPHQYVYGQHNEIIRCPLHGWEFNLQTGKAVFSPSVSMIKYDVQEEDGSIVLYLDKSPERVVRKSFHCVL